MKAFISYDKHITFDLEESGPPQITYTYEFQLGTQHSSVCIFHRQSSLVTPEGGRSSLAHKIKTTRAKLDRLHSVKLIRRDPKFTKLDMQILQVK
jgi:hypothetical protein